MDKEFKKEGTAFVLHNEAGKKVAEIHYQETDEDYVIADHTVVDESLRGQGIAEQLLDKLVTEMEKEHKTIYATCSFVIWKFQKNPDKYDHINYEKQKKA
ncbi:N-acetyltransferase [Desemzia sp. RIT804]|uniref:GNAT family N-acetyltransferase n=1 Tax=Desemzia sp. RIT 804 TaxID=2810209 RepID=UPI00194F32F6|nr:GNAT family N-acetyltransferase [Desemzia sp. RIT 804]MBM6613777.1 N-acetyltransferase [Desemzia sp. RIT 804]